MPGILDLLAGIVGPQQQAPNQLAAVGNIAPSRLDGPGMFSDPGVQAALAGMRQNAPQLPTQTQQAPQAIQGQQMPQRAPAAQSGGNGGPLGGIGDFLGDLLMPQRSAKNRTVQWLQQQGMDEGTATLLAGNKNALQSYLLQRTQGADPKSMLELEKLRLDIEEKRNPTTDDIREYQFAVKQGYKGTLPEFMQEMRKAGATNITTNVGEGDKFYDELDKGNAQMFATLQQDGMNAGQTLIRLDRLGDLLARAPSGAEAQFKMIAGNYGINTEGLDDIQAAQALINQLVPAQRPTGSGPMSDADLELFKQSVPRLINQPGGNQMILETMRGIAEYIRQQGEIANAVANREISAAEGRKLLSRLENPIKPLKGEASPPTEEQYLDQQYRGTGRPGSWRDVGGGVKIRRVQ